MTPPEQLGAATRHRVLLVESDPGDAELVQLWLRSAREARFEIWHVETLGDAEGCLAKADFDLALVDLSLPDASGPWSFHALRERHPDLPIIVFSSFAEAETGVRLLAEGAQDHLVKGQMSGDTLIRSMRHGVAHGRLARELREAREEAEDASRLRSELIAELGQEIRTPLHTILGMADLLLETELSREQEGYVRSFLRASETVLGRFDGLLGSEEVESEAAPQWKAAPSRTSTEAGLRVLVVDDSCEARAHMIAALRGAQHTAESAADGREAIEMFREGEFDLVVMDMQMPELNGLEATRSIRALEDDLGRTPVPILAVTGLSIPGDVGACLEAGCDDHLAKPVCEEDLLAAVSRHAPKHHGRLLRVDGASAEEIDLYLHERHNDLAGLRFALDAGDLASVRALAEGLENSGVSQGFSELAELGRSLQRAAESEDSAELERGAADLSDFLREIKIIVG